MNNTIKIICYGYRPNTAWTNRFIAYAKALVSLGKKVVFIFLIPDNNRSKLDLDIPNIECIYLWETDGPICRKIKSLSYIKNWFSLRRYIDNGDICFFSDASGFYLNEVRFSKKQVKVIFESTEHPEALNRTFNKNIELKIFYRKLHQVNNLLVISQKLKEYYIAKGIAEEKIHVVNMFVDSKRFEGLRKTTFEKNISYCGAVSCYKDGVDILIDAFAKFKEHFPEYKLNIYGSGLLSVIQSLKSRCIELGIANSVMFWGMIPSEQMPQRLYDATILALSRPSNLQSEYGFPTKLGEYLATGNPVVVTSVGEISNFIKDGVNGYISLPDSADEFAMKLIEAATNITKVNIGQSGKALVSSEFNPYVQVESISHILQ